MQCSKGNNKAIKTSWVDSLIAALRYRLKPDVDDVFMSQTTLFWMLHTTWCNHLKYNRRRELLVVLFERREDICWYSWQPKQVLQLRVHRHTTYSMSTNVAAVRLWTSRSRLDYRPAATRVCLSADRVSAVLALLKQPDNHQKRISNLQPTMMHRTPAPHSHLWKSKVLSSFQAFYSLLESILQAWINGKDVDGKLSAQQSPVLH